MKSFEEVAQRRCGGSMGCGGGQPYFTVTGSQQHRSIGDQRTGRIALTQILPKLDGDRVLSDGAKL